MKKSEWKLTIKRIFTFKLESWITVYLFAIFAILIEGLAESRSQARPWIILLGVICWALIMKHEGIIKWKFLKFLE